MGIFIYFATFPKKICGAGNVGPVSGSNMLHGTNIWELVDADDSDLAMT